MTRDATAGVITASQADVVRPVMLLQIDFDSGTTYANNSDRHIDYDINGDGKNVTFLGVGNLGTISTLEETSELQATGMSLQLTGIPATHVSLALNEDYQGRPIRIWQALLDSTYTIIDTPTLVFRGLVNTMSLTFGDIGTVTITAENDLIRWEQPITRRYTNEDQQNEFSGDKGLEFVSQTVEKELIWGRTGG